MRKMRNTKRYSCFTYRNSELMRVEGAIEGSKVAVFAWMREKYGEKLSELQAEALMIPAAVFFFEGDCQSFWLSDDEGVFLMEILDEDAV